MALLSRLMALLPQDNCQRKGTLTAAAKLSATARRGNVGSDAAAEQRHHGVRDRTSIIGSIRNRYNMSIGNLETLLFAMAGGEGGSLQPTRNTMPSIRSQRRQRLNIVLDIREHHLPVLREQPARGGRIADTPWPCSSSTARYGTPRRTSAASSRCCENSGIATFATY